MSRGRAIGGLSGLTLVSRLLGLGRDMLVFALLGAGTVNSAFVLAFTLPNLFRRLLGEGALTSAVLPVLAEKFERGGPAAGFGLLNAVARRLGLGLGLLSVAVGALMLLVPLVPGLEPRWYLAAALSVWLFPYVLLVCLAALYAAALNSLKRFVVAGASQVLINGAILMCAGLPPLLLPVGPAEKLVGLAAGVLVGGLLQVWSARWGLARQGWTPAHRPPPGDKALGRVFRLLLPALAAAAVYQVNVAVTRFLAFGLNESAAALLYLCARLVELPLGVFAVSVTTVLFPALAALAARGDRPALAREWAGGLRLILLVNLPAALGLALLAEPTLRMLFAWGRFGEADVLAAAAPLAVSVWGIPFFAWASYATRGLHALQDTATPFRLAMVNLVANAGLGLALMGSLGVSGLALAGVLAAALQSLLLQRALARALAAGPGALTPPAGWWARLLAALGALGAAVWGLGALPFWDALPPKLAATARCAALIPAGAAAYFGVLAALRAPELATLRARLARRPR